MKMTANATIAEGGAGPYNGREARNLAEKHRRDKLNASIQELAKMVPHVAESTRRLDKTAVLRFAAHGLRLQYVFGKSDIKKRREPQLTDKLMQLLDSFFITMTCHGQIVLISASVELLLGHCQSDLYGQNILHITHPDDQALLLQQLIPHNLETLFRNEYHKHSSVEEDDDDADIDEPTDIGDFYSSSNIRDFDEVDKRLRTDRRCFTVRLARAGTRSEVSRNYELVKIDGCFRRSDCSVTAGGVPIVSQLIRRSRSNSNANMSCITQHDSIAKAALHGVSGNDIVLVAMARIIRPQKILNRLLEANQLEYRTRHLIDGRIIDCDQRIGIVAGYMKDEVRNLSPFSFMHQDDVRWVIVALRQMYDCNSDYGESCYRLLSRNGHFIYLQTKGYLEIDKSTNKVHSFVCVNTLLDEEEGQRKVQEMKKKFSIIINTKIPTNSLQDVPASQNPQQLERIVLYLIENLQKRNESNAIDGVITASQPDNNRYATTPPLALVPPEPASVKNSITKSVNVVNVTAAKNLQHNLKSPNSIPGSETSLSPTSSVDHVEDYDENINSNTFSFSKERPSVLKINKLKMKISTTPANDTKLTITKMPNSSSMSTSTTKSATSVPVSPTQQLQKQITVLKRLRSSPASSISDDSISPPKRTSKTITKKNPTATATATATFSDIHTVLSSSLQKLDRSLNTIDQGARTLCSRLLPTVPNKIPQQLDAIIVEQQMQKEILVNIKSEYDEHVQQYQPLLHQNVSTHSASTSSVAVKTEISTMSDTNKRTVICKSEPL